MKPVVRVIACALPALALACAPSARDVGRTPPPPAGGVTTPLHRYANVGRIDFGEPVAVTVDFDGNVYVADGSPGRLVRFRPAAGTALEFQRPTSNPAFYPTDVAIRGFFVYAVDEAGRNVVRFDRDGAYRDVLLSFDNLDVGRRVSPYGLDTDAAGRIAVTDVENHQVWVFDTYLVLQFNVGNYGSFPGQLDSPQGVSFDTDGGLIVADTGNRRIQRFADGGGARGIIPPAGSTNPLVRPRRAAVAKDGRLYVADPGAGAVFVFSPDGALVRTIVPADAPGFAPSDLFLQRPGRLVVTDPSTATVYVFEVV